MIFGNKSKDLFTAIVKSTVKESECEKRLGVPFDNKLNFTKHVQYLCTQKHQTLHAPDRLSNYIDLIKLKLPMNAVIKSQFIYTPLLWTFQDRMVTSKLNKVIERTIPFACNDSGYNSVNDYYNLNKSLTTHQHNLQLLMMEVFKTMKVRTTIYISLRIFSLAAAPYSPNCRIV